MKNSVKDMLDAKAYELLKLPTIEFRYGNIEFFDRETIDEAQAGFRYIGTDGEKSEDWPGDEYVIIGYDSSVGCGPDPYIVKTDDPNLPVYWLMTDSEDWSELDEVCDKLEDFNKIINMLTEYSDYLGNEELDEEIKKEILDKIGDIVGKDNVSYYWDRLLDNAMPFEE